MTEYDLVLSKGPSFAELDLLDEREGTKLNEVKHKQINRNASTTKWRDEHGYEIKLNNRSMFVLVADAF